MCGGRWRTFRPTARWAAPNDTNAGLAGYKHLEPLGTGVGRMVGVVAGPKGRGQDHHTADNTRQKLDALVRAFHKPQLMKTDWFSCLLSFKFKNGTQFHAVGKVPGVPLHDDAQQRRIKAPPCTRQVVML